ncbi:MAG: UPF0182 family protein, partial [Acidobacteria bacterium]|nr:UPF0182 family protein [Acidobacteriota bacterium]
NDGLEFVKIVTFTPANRNNLIAIMAGRSDGDAYGKLMVYTLPKSRFIDGPIQIEARIDQDPTLSGQFTLWNQQGSRIERGNLMVIPVGDGLLYVQPIYLQAERSPMPELRTVVLATQEKISYGPNFASALANMFGEAAGKKDEPKDAEKDGKKETNTETTVSPNTQQLIERAAQEFADYQKLTSEGKLADAGKKLEDLKRTLEELKNGG